MVNKLTPKQEGFALSVASGVSYSQAYRDNYNAGTMPNESIWVKASEVMSNVKVGLRVAELQDMAQERTLVTVESLTTELEEARALATEEKQAAAMTGATMGKAKLHGLDVQKVEQVGAINIVLGLNVDDI